jgi:hypothetical protein
MELSDKPSFLTPTFNIDQFKNANILITNSFLNQSTLRPQSSSSLASLVPDSGATMDFGRLLP